MLFHQAGERRGRRLFRIRRDLICKDRSDGPPQAVQVVSIDAGLAVK